jgi:hypothetical protein
MSPRALRRAAEHAARKAAAKQAKLQATEQAQPVAAEPKAESPESEPQVMYATAGATASKPFIPNPAFEEESFEEPTPRPVSEAQLNANRANAQKSTGPVSQAGRSKSSLNAVKTGLTGATVLLAADDALAYRAHLNRHFKRYSPANEEEHTLVQIIADTEWRLLRIPGLEASIYAIGSRKLADLHPEEADPSARQALITGEVYMAYRRDLKNLALQERRLRNQQKSDIEKLKALQDERLEKKNEKAKIQARMYEAIRAMNTAKKIYDVFSPVEFGFEFSLYEIEYCEVLLGRAQCFGHQAPCIADVLVSLRNDQTEAKAA